MDKENASRSFQLFLAFDGYEVNQIQRSVNKQSSFHNERTVSFILDAVRGGKILTNSVQISFRIILKSLKLFSLQLFRSFVNISSQCLQRESDIVVTIVFSTLRPKIHGRLGQMDVNNARKTSQRKILFQLRVSRHVGTFVETLP